MYIYIYIYIQRSTRKIEQFFLDGFVDDVFPLKFRGGHGTFSALLRCSGGWEWYFLKRLKDDTRRMLGLDVFLSFFLTFVYSLHV